MIEFVFLRPSSLHGIIRPNFRHINFSVRTLIFLIISFYQSSLDLKKSFLWLLDLRLKSVRCFSEEFDLLSNDFCLLTILGFWSILDLWIILGSTWTSDSWVAIYSSLNNLLQLCHFSEFLDFYLFSSLKGQCSLNISYMR